MNARRRAWSALAATALGAVASTSCTVSLPARGGDAGAAPVADARGPDAAAGGLDARPPGPDARAPGPDARTAGGGSGGAGGSAGSGGTGDLGPPDGAVVDAAADRKAGLKPDAAGGRPGDAATETLDVGPAPDAAPPCPDVPETCNGLDDDCDGYIDNAARCGDLVASACSVWLVWSDGVQPPVVDTWGECPAQPQDASPDRDQSIACTSTQGDPRFHAIAFSGNVDANDALGVAFTCSEGAGAVGQWMQANCRVYLGQIDVLGTDVIPNDVEALGACPGANEGGDGTVQCVGSGGDGRFHSMTLLGDVNDDDRFAIAFRCEAPDVGNAASEQRARMLTASVRVFLGYTADWWVEDSLTYDDWGTCPGEDRDADGDYRCVSSQRDGRFHAIPLGTFFNPDLDGDDMFSIALLSAEE